MARRPFKSGSENVWASAIQGALKGYETTKSLQEMAAERALKQQEAELKKDEMSLKVEQAGKGQTLQGMDSAGRPTYLTSPGLPSSTLDFFRKKYGTPAESNPIPLPEGTTQLPPSTLKTGMRPPASPDDAAAAKLRAKIESEKPKALGSFNNTKREFDNMISEAKAIRDDEAVGKATGAVLGRVTMPGGATRVASRLDTLKAKTLLGVLASMKDLSKNGASGFGALSEMEGENIKNSVSSLARIQDKKDFKASLDRFIQEMEARKTTLDDTFRSTYGDMGQAVSSAPAGSAALPDATGHVVGQQYKMKNGQMATYVGNGEFE